MNQIGFAINYASQGMSTPIKINADGHWDRGIIDLRHVIANVQPEFRDSGKCVLIMSFDSQGCYVAIARSISGRSNDFVAGWLYIPAGLIISGHEVQQLLAQVRAAISDSDFSPYVQTLEQLFGRTYQMRAASIPYRTSNPRGQFAGRDCSTYDLDTLLGDARYQPYYADYQCIFLVQDFATTLNANVINLSDRQLTQTCVVLPPSADEVAAAFGPGVEVLSKDGIPFTSAVCVERGQVLQLIAVRQGYADIPFSYRALNDGAPVVLPTANRWLKHVSASDIRVFDAITREPVNAEIRINDAILGSVGLDMPVNSLSNARLVVSRRGYRSCSQSVDLNRVPIQVNMTPLTSAPERGSRLQPAPKQRNPLVMMLIGFGAALLLGGMVWGGIALFGDEEKGSTSSTASTLVASTSTSTGSVTTEGTSTSADASTETTSAGKLELNVAADPKPGIEYLNSHKVWTREEMEAIPSLKGLWDDLNNYNLEKLKTQWADILIASENDGKKLIDEIKMIKDFSKTRALLPTTCSENGKINRYNYLIGVSNARQGKAQNTNKKPTDKKTETSDNKPAGGSSAKEVSSTEKSSTIVGVIGR